NNVDIVFNSHTIVYERSHPITGNRIDFDRGVRYIVVGGAGAAPDWFFHKKSWHTAKSRAIPHFVHVVITSGHLELHAIDYEGNLFDTLVIDKNLRKGNH
ncbi:MAG: metallophosphoesterase, partial [Saccharofermentanales bacterium]